MFRSGALPQLARSSSIMRSAWAQRADRRADAIGNHSSLMRMQRVSALMRMQRVSAMHGARIRLLDRDVARWLGEALDPILDVSECFEAGSERRDRNILQHIGRDGV